MSSLLLFPMLLGDGIAIKNNDFTVIPGILFQHTTKDIKLDLPLYLHLVDAKYHDIISGLVVKKADKT